MQDKHISLIDFKDTKTAFKDKSDIDLREMQLLFRVMNSKNLVQLGKQAVRFASTLHLPINWIIKRTLYKHFCGGTSIKDSMRVVNKLHSNNIKTILDYAVEGEESEKRFDATANEIMRTIEVAHDNKNEIPFSVFKITGVGSFDLMAKVSNNEILTQDEVISLGKLMKRVNDIFKLGYELKVPVMIDAEQSWIQPMLDDLVLNMMRKYNKDHAIVQNTYQMYRHDRLEVIKEHHKISQEENFKFGLKIVRGAYMEVERERALQKGYPSPIQPNKEATDKDFDDIIRYFVDNVDTISFMIATHNEESTQLLVSLIEEKQLPHDHPHIYFSQLYGMSDHITYNVAKKGFNVVKYMPYGEVKTMLPYLIRRAEENSSVKGQSSRELLLIEQEIKRRKSNRYISR